MHEIKFDKIVASGNDFIAIRLSGYPAIRLRKLARKICDRKYGVGADGLLILEKSKIADIKMRIFNTDGSEAEMCGNGARCVALWAKSKILKIETKAGIIEAEVNDNNVKIKLSNPMDIKLNIPIKINNRSLRVNFINTGVAHTVIFVEGLDKIDVLNLGRKIRYHHKFAPQGTNVNFVEVLGSDSIRLRTYERGVEGETLACGTGAVAAALILATGSSLLDTYRVNVHTQSGEILKVYFKYKDNKFSDVCLEGKVRMVYTGVYYV